MTGESRFTEVATEIFVTDHRVVEGKNSVVLGERTSLVVDTGLYPEDGQRIEEFLAGRAERLRAIAYTHGHGDHVGGSGCITASEVYGHLLTPKVMQPDMAAAKERYGPDGTGPRWPTVRVDGTLEIDLGGKTARLFPTPGHSVDSSCVYIVEDRVLFTGDTVVSCIPPGVGDSTAMEASLRALHKLDVEVLVPGHGPVVHGAADTRSLLRWLADYLAGVRAAVDRALASTNDLEEIVSSVDYASVIGDRLAPDRHDNAERHRDTVMKIAEEQLQGRHAEPT